VHRYAQNGVPLGLLYAARGATRAASGVPRSLLESRPEYADLLNRKVNRDWQPVNGQPNVKRPSALYHGTIHPLMPFAIKGVLWYQGESDSRDAATYRLLFPVPIRKPL
jgi:sialate O-acetylesterase